MSTPTIQDRLASLGITVASWGADITRQALIGLAVFLALAAIGMAIYFRTWKMSAAAMFDFR